jgi:hypothetical protein
MNGLKTFLFITVSCLVASPLYADIYKWTDESGVQHFSNYNPPGNARVWMKTKDVPYDEAADHERIEIEQREAEAERRLAETDRQAEETALESEEFLDEARSDRYAYQSYGFYGYYPGYNRHPHVKHHKYGHYKKRYYGHHRKHDRYKYRQKTHPHVKHHKYGHYKKRYYGHHRKHDRYKYRQKTHHYKKAHQPKHVLKSRGTNNHGALRIRSLGRGNQGQRNFSRARSSLWRH